MPRKDSSRPVFRLIFRAEILRDEVSGQEVPPEIRLRRLLKFAWRFCRLRCLDHVELPPGWTDHK